jgi:hypothetical protein
METFKDLMEYEDDRLDEGLRFPGQSPIQFGITGQGHIEPRSRRCPPPQPQHGRINISFVSQRLFP